MEHIVTEQQQLVNHAQQVTFVSMVKQNHARQEKNVLAVMNTLVELIKNVKMVRISEIWVVDVWTFCCKFAKIIQIIMNKLFTSIVCGLLTLSCTAQNASEQEMTDVASGEPSVVYMTKEISPESIVKLYKALGREATGKVAIKISTGEPGGHNYLQPALIKDFVDLTKGTIVECNTAYNGRRFSTEDHRKAAEEHGFTAIAPVDIMDA